MTNEQFDALLDMIEAELRFHHLSYPQETHIKTREDAREQARRAFVDENNDG